MDARQLIAKHEGRRKFPYKDSRNIWSIGIGHNLQVDPTLYPQLKHLIEVGLTDAQIDDIYDHDVAKVLHDLDLYLPWWRNLDPTRRAVMQDMCFNMGIGKLLDFHHFLDAMKAGDFARARTEMLDSAWAKEVPNRANEDASLVHDEEGSSPDPFLRAA